LQALLNACGPNMKLRSKLNQLSSNDARIKSSAAVLETVS
jgi:hypothetical protein